MRRSERRYLQCIAKALTMHQMSTTKPRITITLEEGTALRLRRISELTGNSQSALVSEVLDQAQDVFDRLIVVLEAAKQANSTLSKSAIEGLERAQRRIEKHLGIAMEDFNQATEPLFPEKKVQRRARKGAPLAGVGFAPEASPDFVKRQVQSPSKKPASANLTPLSNRGVRSTPDKPIKTSRKARDAQI